MNIAFVSILFTLACGIFAAEGEGVVKDVLTIDGLFNGKVYVLDNSK
jgi:hypothetical protein